MSDKRTVATDALETLGNLIDENGKRDAIHLAVEPCIAAHDLTPGQHVGIEDGKATSATKKKLGIVDPFITSDIPAGGRFWLVVYPRQITSLRHVWTHPDFEEPVEEPSQEVTSEKQNSERWIADFAQSVSLKYDVLMDGADDWLNTHDGRWGGEYLCFGGLLEGESVPDEFWNHYEIVRGVKVEGSKRGSFFTCSC